MLRPRGRYAPSPTGELHVGNASTALLAWLSARAKEGAFVLRLEDLDRGRSRPELAHHILEDLAWLGLDWDEGPDRGGPHAPYDQGSRFDRYHAAFACLRDAGLLYRCFCSRRDVAAAVNAPHGAGDEIPYPGTCRDLDRAVAAERAASGARHSWRFRADERPVFTDLVRGRYGQDAPEPGDFVVYRADGAAAYQLAVVVDDAAMQITEVIRGNDLLPSTLKQLMLFRALRLEPPSFAHVPLLLGPDGVRLAKRHAGASVSELRDRGLSPEQVIGRLAHGLGLRPDPTAVSAAELVPGFDLAALAPVPQEIRVDPRTWV